MKLYRTNDTNGDEYALVRSETVSPYWLNVARRMALEKIAIGKADKLHVVIFCCSDEIDVITDESFETYKQWCVPMLWCLTVTRDGCAWNVDDLFAMYRDESEETREMLPEMEASIARWAEAGVPA